MNSQRFNVAKSIQGISNDAIWSFLTAMIILVLFSSIFILSYVADDSTTTRIERACRIEGITAVRMDHQIHQCQELPTVNRAVDTEGN